MILRPILLSAVLLVAAAAGGCGERPTEPIRASEVSPQPSPPAKVSLHLVAFATAREAYDKRIIPEFKQYWRTTRRMEVEFVESYESSGAQARAVVGGLEADVAALSLAQDLDQIAKAGLIRGDWRSTNHGGVVSRSIVAFAVRKGNPEKIHDWPDLMRRPYSIVMPDPAFSEGGRWIVCAAYGAALRGHAGVAEGDPGSAQAFLTRLFRRVERMDKDARGSFKTFEGGMGDVALTSESEVIRGRMFGHDYELVIPKSTLRIDNPAAVIDVYAERHGVLDVARGFVEFLSTPAAQRAYVFYGLRPVDDAIAAELRAIYPIPRDLWTIDDLGGSERVSKEFFGPHGNVERAREEASDR